MKSSLESTISEWLFRYALTIRDAASAAPVQITRATIEAYCAFLADCEAERLGRAMRIAGMNARFFPTPERIRGCYQTLLEKDERGARPKCAKCEGCGYVAGAKGLIRCVECSPGVVENGKRQ